MQNMHGDSTITLIDWGHLRVSNPGWAYIIYGLKNHWVPDE